MKVRASLWALPLFFAAFYGKMPDPLADTAVIQIRSKNNSRQMAGDVSVCFYEDEKGEKPVEVNGEPLVLKTDENGEIHTDIPNDRAWIKLQNEVKGYYAPDQFVRIDADQKNVIELEPVIVSIKKENAEDQVWIEDGQNPDTFLFTPGKTYVVNGRSADPWHYYRPLEISIPLQMPEGNLQYSLSREECGRLLIQADGIDEMKIRIFLDEEGREEFEESDGKKIRLSEDSELCLPEGKYWLKAEYLDPSYLLDDHLYPVIIENGKRTEVKLSPEKAAFRIHCYDAADGKDITVKWKTDVNSFSSGQWIPVERGKVQKLQAVSAENGYYLPDPVSAELKAGAFENMTIECPVHSWKTEFSLYDSMNGNSVKGKWIILDQKGEKTDCLKPGESYSLHITDIDGWYVRPSAVSFQIPAKALNEGVTLIEKKIAVVPYGKLTAQIPENGIWSLYRDKECTLPAYSIAGDKIVKVHGNASLSLLCGTYYYRMDALPLGWYPDSDIHSIQIHSQSESSLLPDVKKAVLEIRSRYDQSEKDVLLGLYNESGALITRWNTGNETVSCTQVCPGHRYTVKVLNTGAHLRAVRPEQTIQIPEFCPDKNPEVTFDLQKTSAVTLKATGRYSPPDNVQYGIYTDPHLKNPAFDQNGKRLYASLNSFGTGNISLKPGVYYLQETQLSDHWYRRSEEPLRLDCRNGDKQITIDYEEVTLKFEAKDESGKALKGGAFSLFDANGNIICEWTSGDEAEMITDENLKRGEKYTIHEKRPAEGYEPSRDITVRIPSDQTESASSQTIKKKEGKIDTVWKMESRKENVRIAALAVCGVIAVIIVTSGLIFLKRRER